MTKTQSNAWRIVSYDDPQGGTLQTGHPLVEVRNGKPIWNGADDAIPCLWTTQSKAEQVLATILDNYPFEGKPDFRVEEMVRKAKRIKWERHHDRMWDYFLRSEHLINKEMELDCRYFIQEYNGAFELYLDDNINPIDHILVARGNMDDIIDEAEKDYDARERGTITRNKDGDMVHRNCGDGA